MQLAQAAHAAAEFVNQHRVEAQQWFEHSNYIVILGVPDGETLLLHASAAPVSTLVFEPDIDAHTALAIAPGPYWQHLQSLPLALREPAMA